MSGRTKVGLVGRYLHIQTSKNVLGDNLTYISEEVSPGLYIGNTVNTTDGSPKGPDVLTSISADAVDKLEHASIGVVVFSSVEKYREWRDKED